MKKKLEPNSLYLCIYLINKADSKKKKKRMWLASFTCEAVGAQKLQ